MADKEVVQYIRDNIAQFDLTSIKAQLLKDGVTPEEIEDAVTEYSGSDQGPRSHLTTYAVVAGCLLLLVAVFFAVQGPAPKARAELDEDTPPDSDIVAGTRDSVFHGHYGYILKLPTGYQASPSFEDAQKTIEVVHLFPKGTSPTNLMHEGLYGELGILRLQVSPRRMPEGYVGVEKLKAWVTQRLTQEKSSFTMRQLVVNGMPAFIAIVDKPFKSATAYVVGQKVRYTVLSGDENEVFTGILSSLVEVSPHDRPGS